MLFLTTGDLRRLPRQNPEKDRPQSWQRSLCFGRCRGDEAPQAPFFRFMVFPGDDILRAKTDPLMPE